MATAKKQYVVQTIFTAIDRMGKPITTMTKSMDDMQEKAYYADRYMTDMFTKTTIALSGLAAMFGYATKSAAWFETAAVKMATKLDGSTEKANKLIKSIQSLAIKSPLTAKPLIESADILLAHGVKYENVLTTLRKLGDLSQGSDEVLASVTRGYGRILSEDRVTREHLDRFINKGGVSIYKAMADTMGITHQEFSKLVEQGKIDSAIMLDAVDALTSKGGLYYRAMDNQMNTMNGLLAQFSESLSKIIQKLGELVNPVSKFFLRGYNNYFEDIVTKLEDSFGFEKVSYVKDGPNGKEVEHWLYPKNDATSGIMLSFYDLFEVISKNKPNIDKMISRLDDGTSLFYDFMDVLGYVVKSFKRFIGILDFLSKIPLVGGFIKFFLEIGTFFSPFIFMIIKGIKNFLSIKDTWGSISLFFEKTKLKMAKLFGFTHLKKLGQSKIFLKIAGFFKNILPNGIKVLGKTLGVAGSVMTVFGLFFKHFESWRDIVKSVFDSFDAWIEKLPAFKWGLDFIKDTIISFITGDFKMLLFTAFGFVWDMLFVLVDSLLTDIDRKTLELSKDFTDNIRDFFTGYSKINQDKIHSLQVDKGLINNNNVNLNLNVSTNQNKNGDTDVSVSATDEDGKPFGKEIKINNSWSQKFYMTAEQRTF